MALKQKPCNSRTLELCSNPTKIRLQTDVELGSYYIKQDFTANWTAIAQAKSVIVFLK